MLTVDSRHYAQGIRSWNDRLRDQGLRALKECSFFGLFIKVGLKVAQRGVGIFQAPEVQKVSARHVSQSVEA
jgi:hypothetical protein